MSAAIVLPLVWACDALPGMAEQAPQKRIEAIEPQLAFYRKYTEAMLRRYLRCSMEIGRTPALLGKEIFRARVTNYRMQSFEDTVIFVHDMEKCVGKLSQLQQQLVLRISIQQYTQAETAALLGISLRSTIRQYKEAIDRLTAILLGAKMLEPFKACQEGERRF